MTRVPPSDVESFGRKVATTVPQRNSFEHTCGDLGFLVYSKTLYSSSEWCVPIFLI